MRLSEPPPAANVSTIIANRMSTSAHSRSAVAFMSVRKSETYSRWVTRSTVPTSSPSRYTVAVPTTLPLLTVAAMLSGRSKE